MIQGARKTPVPRVKSAHLSAPIGGINTIAVGTDMPASDCIYCYNMIGGEYGLRSRLGSREWVTGLDGDPRSILPFTGSLTDGSTNRLFACTLSGIWDCSSSSQAPTRVVTFATQSDDAGWGISTAFTDLNGNHWLLYCDEANGYYTYAESGATWTKVVRNDSSPGAGQIGGVDPANFVAVIPWKNRLWFVEKGTQRAWYLGLNSLYGAATSFNFGARFKAGGDLRILASWTDTGGNTIDDRLVAISGGGDVVIYQGIDPSSASTFSIVGVWFLGSVPAGRRLCTDFGGDLLVMSSVGIYPLSKLVIGTVLYDRSQYATAKISNLFNDMQRQIGFQRGWAMRLHPADASLIVLTPSQVPMQLAMSLTTRGWSQYRDMPMGVCAEPWNGSLYFGSGDGSGRVLINDGDADGVTLANPNSSVPVTFSVLGAFSNLGRPTQKRVQVIKTRLQSAGGYIPNQAKSLYDFDFSEIGSVTGSPGASTWDSGTWDSTVWAGSMLPQVQTFGSAGVGSNVAIAVKGTATSRATLVGVDVWFDEGTGL